MTTSRDPLGFKHPLRATPEYISFTQAYEVICSSRLEVWENYLKFHSLTGPYTSFHLSGSTSTSNLSLASTVAAKNRQSHNQSNVQKNQSSWTRSDSNLISNSTSTSRPASYGRRMSHPLPRSDQVKRMVRKGIPMKHRASVWFKFSGAEALCAQEPGLYTILCFREAQDRRQGYHSGNNAILEYVDIIERDLYRTFPDNDFFQHQPRSTSSPCVSPDPHPQFTFGSSPTLSNLSLGTMNSSPNLSSGGLESNCVPCTSDAVIPSNSVSSLASLSSQLSNSTAVEDMPMLSDYHSKFTIPISPGGTTSAQSSCSAPSLPKISNETNIYILSLRQVLVSFAYYSWPHPDESRTPWRTCPYPIGYCQSLNFIVGMLLLVFVQSDPQTNAAFTSGDEAVRIEVEQSVFWMLVAIVECLLPPEMYGYTLEGSQIQQEVLWTWILKHKGSKFGLERLSKWLEMINGRSGSKDSTFLGQDSSSMDIDSYSSALAMVTTPWFMTLFVNTMPTETVLRIWDCFFYQGEKILFRVALTLLHIHEEKLIECQDMADAWRLLKDLPKSVIDCEEFITLCFKPRVVGNPFGSGLRPASPRLSRFPPSPVRMGSENGRHARRPEDDSSSMQTSSLPTPIHTQQQEHSFTSTSHVSDTSRWRSRTSGLSGSPLTPFQNAVRRHRARQQSPPVHYRPTSPFRPQATPSHAHVNHHITGLGGNGLSFGIGGVNQKIIEKYRSLVMERRHHVRQNAAASQSIRRNK
ncbi:hypothetical protein BATDEDRAFT_21189 [Batrachochytrium dendrobatidis JAM81]|uniref:Rab-GAP TBC domain-containing protein n=1 Tax=Batrachochytrium dendrobatidis (strain JAM81 / FGSC 10211) TaxID=684364 RepID=F4NRL5_BATDJ|nr:uncharacterized protein BATDEDRAFT_21189 [Batrachochytrium dendrobatidis JAM81]EGF83751.1 hypothetical protein BATDEDRAFT_21189 [Batrachochytrium dendrobatidis JAM81]|eukprot:XP_006675222.1 hypothetical protein BATDEDRAFT_21189 [Batrachochytrium dendrobatidis JAM81]